MLEAGGAHSLVRHRSAGLKRGLAILPGAEVVLQPTAVCQCAEELDQLFASHICDRNHNLRRASLGADGVLFSPVEVLRRTLAGDGQFMVVCARDQKEPLASIAWRAVYLARPVRAAVRRALDETADAADWALGYCPSCGLWPRMAWLDSESQRRMLWCLGCDMTWEFRRFQCPFCMGTDPSHHRYLEVGGNPFCRLDVCEVCRRYLKTLTCSPCDAELAYFETEYLDAAASEAGYIRDFIGFVAFDGKPSRALANYIEKSSS